MRYPSDLLDEIRTRIPISQVVGRKVKLKKSGRTWKGLCPFHSERTPSFTCDDVRATFKCFGCGEGGDVFGFLIKTGGLTFPEAVERLANDAGVVLPQSNPQSVKREAHKLTLIEIMEEAGRFFRSQLNPEVREYLTARKITPALIDEFGIGLAPDDRSALKAHLAHAGVEQTDMIEAGLLIAGDNIAISYDRFRNRVMFPIHDAKGRTVAFGGRALAKDAQAKYLNSPETPIFRKGHLLYNTHRARDAAWEGKPLVVVEGYTGAIASHAAGFATVATMGTALTDDQLHALWRMSDEPIICFDGDGAGRKAARRVIDVALLLILPGRGLRFSYLPDGLDPDDMIRGRGPEAYSAVVSASERLVDALWRAETVGRSTYSPDDRAALEGRLMAAVGVIETPQHRDKYQAEYRDRVRALGARTKISRSNSNSHHSMSPGAIRLAHGVRYDGMPLRDAMLLSAIVAAPETAVTVIERLADDRSLSAEAATTVHGILDILSTLPDATVAALKTALNGNATIVAAQEVCHRAGIISLDQDGAATRAILLRH